MSKNCNYRNVDRMKNKYVFTFWPLKLCRFTQKGFILYTRKSYNTLSNTLHQKSFIVSYHIRLCWCGRRIYWTLYFQQIKIKKVLMKLCLCHLYFLRCKRYLEYTIVTCAGCYCNTSCNKNYSIKKCISLTCSFIRGETG